MDDLDKLRAVAEAATPGPWRKYNDGVVGFPVDEETVEGIGKGFRPAAGSDTDYDQRLLDAIYVATFDPPTVLALIDRAERAETERDETQEYRDLYKLELDAADADLAALRAAVTNLADEIDAERAVLIRNASVANEPSRLSTRLRSLLAAAPTETEGTHDE